VTAYWSSYAWLPDGLEADVRVEVEADRIRSVTSGTPPAPADVRLSGVVLPGLADAHSHAFHRALRGRTHLASDSFWSWRSTMYDVADRLDPDSLLALATAAFAESALAGFSVVGEFHYLHHAAGGRPYDDPNAMGEALREAANLAGVRLTLLDACYLTGGIGQPLQGVQERFGDGSADAWANRVAALKPDSTTRIGAAVHSVRAVPARDLGVVAANSNEFPLHVHVSEQPAENEQCEAAYGCSPTQLLAGRGVLSPRTTVVHATHVSEHDIELLAQTGSRACLCPTTERDLADGIGPAGMLHRAGVALSLGSDQRAIVDGFEEMRGIEMHERLVTGKRGYFPTGQLIDAATIHGHGALGWPDAGRIAPGYLADLVAVRLDTVRTAGVNADQVPFAATAADIDTVIVGGEVVVENGQHRLGDVAQLLLDAITAVTR
jgi:formiminoglutamate deiminase